VLWGRDLMWMNCMNEMEWGFVMEGVGGIFAVLQCVLLACIF
jgi:hypothetical protein